MSVMTHVVAGYPSYDECIELMLGMQRAGVDIIEVQIPFSDPIADGETIMRANDAALENGMDISRSFDLIKQAKENGLSSKIYIMSYAQKLVHCGIDEFCQKAASSGASGLIVPDLPYDSPEYEELLGAVDKNNLEIVPVVSPGMSDERLSGELAHSGSLIYLTSMKGITGKKLRVSDALPEFAAKVKKSVPEASLAIGFGVQRKEDVEDILKIADIAVVGSAVIKEIQSNGTGGALKFIGSLVSD